MTEQQHLGALFQNLYNGHPWIDVTLTGVLENIPAEKAQQRVGHCNTIWEIVVHMIRWRENVLQRVQGAVLKTPANNYIEVIAMKRPATKQAGKILGTDATAVPELVRLLREEAKVI